MVRLLFRYYIHIISKYKKRVYPSDRSPPKVGLEVFEKLGPALWALTGIGLGISAYQISTSESMKFWEQSRLPSSTVWKYLLEFHGFKKIVYSKQSERPLRNLPVTLDQKGAVWATPELTWITLFNSPDLPIPFELYCLQCDRDDIPKLWNAIGYGWAAFDKVSSKMDDKKVGLRMMPIKKEARSFHDPLEILY